MTVMANYRAALGAPGMTRVMAALLTCYLLAAMINLGLMLTAYTATGGYAVAGAVTGAYSATVAFAAPVWGRMVDRRGPRWTLAFTVSLQTAAFAAFAGIAKKVFAQVDDPQSKRATFAMSGLFAEIVFVLGPLAIGGIVILVEPMYAVIVTAVISLAGSCGCAAHPPYVPSRP